MSMKKCGFRLGREGNVAAIKGMFADVPGVGDATTHAALEAETIGDCDWRDLSPAEIEASSEFCPKHHELWLELHGEDADLDEVN